MTFIFTGAMQRLLSRAQLCFALFHTTVLHLTGGTVAESSAALSFEAFTQQYGRTYEGGLAEYQERQTLFEARRAKVLDQNHRKHRRWTAAINIFSDRTADELARLRGWRRRGSPTEHHGHGAASAARHAGHHHATAGESLSLRQLERAMPRAQLPKRVSWGFLNATKRHYNQGSCGSCWAIASAVLLEAHSEIHSPHGQGRTFSAQELVSCVPNPQHCGGTGGCEGATIELAMDWTFKHGLAEDSAVPYIAMDGVCNNDQSQGSSLLQILDRPSMRKTSPREEDGYGSDASDASAPGALFGMTSWERLPENKYDALLQALQDGPVGISVAASDWFDYSYGVFDRCEKDAIIDHAVVLLGYGRDESEGYWLIKNSWGPEWGEHGSMRLLRRGEGKDDEDDEGSWCGVDRQPELGSGCDGGPSEVTVCGTCGILYDTVVPHWQGSADRAKQQFLQAQKMDTEEY